MKETLYAHSISLEMVKNFIRLRCNMRGSLEEAKKAIIEPDTRFKMYKITIEEVQEDAI